MGLVNVVFVEDDPRYLRSLEELFTHTDGFRVVGAYDSVAAALEQASSSWDLVLMDINMPGTDGIEGTRRLKQRVPRVAVVILTVFEEPDTILRAICAGANGYLLKKSSAKQLIAAARDIVSGGAPLTAGVARTVLEMLRTVGVESDAPTPSRLNLTEREQQVLRCLVDGKSYKQAAATLGIALETVRSHIKNLYKKLQVHSVAEAVSRAIRERIV